MYLKLSVAGHFKIFLTRTRGPFWSIRPARILLVAVFGTQILATLAAVYGVLMPPIGWGWAGLVWGYSLVWFLVNDRVKLLAYRIFDPVKAVARPEAEPEVKTKTQTETNAEPQRDAKAEAESGSKTEAKSEENVAPAQGTSGEANPKTESKSDVNSAPETKARTATDLTPQIAARAYELYEQQGHRDGQSAQNWAKAEQEIRETQAKAEPMVETKPIAKAELKPDTHSKPEARVEPEPAAKVVPESETPSAEPQPVPPSKVNAEPKPDGKAETKSEPNVKPAREVSPQLVRKVHEFYEQLGRADVRAVQESDEAEQKIPEAETKNKPA
jgi:H+-transporting ATPase